MLDQNHQIRLACRYVVDGKSVLRTRSPKGLDPRWLRLQGLARLRLRVRSLSFQPLIDVSCL